MITRHLASAPRGHFRNLFAAGLLCLAISQPAFAAGEVPSTSELKSSAYTGPRPWADGVPGERQDAAEKLFLEGNRLFSDSFFKAASQKYREALGHWDHPSIHYNLALSLINMDDPIEAYRQLVEALKYSGAPLDDKRRDEANRHLKATQRQISTLEISCKEAGAVVTLDGREVIKAPNQISEILLPGRHLVSARKPGYLPREYPITLVPGEPQKLDIKLYTEGDLVEMSRPVPFWIPVAVTGVGVGMVVTGAILATRSNTLYERYDSSISEKYPDGTQASRTRLDWRDDAGTLKTWSTISYIAGAATVTGGGLWMWFNRSRTKTYTPEQRERNTTTVTPIVSAGVVGAIATGRF
ncbi:MAG TPA: PEGA domain-containing protein [Polyangiaceae bacterium]|nr:PEGA domain-containing protein [Polyangiaceae bacterium]